MSGGLFPKIFIWCYFREWWPLEKTKASLHEKEVLEILTTYLSPRFPALGIVYGTRGNLVRWEFESDLDQLSLLIP